MSVKAAAVTVTESFRTGYTLRFPRFKNIRTDRDWKSALSLTEFTQLKNNVEVQKQEKRMKIDDSRRRKQRVPRKKPLVVAGSNTQFTTPYDGPTTQILDGLNFLVTSDSLHPEKMSKEQLEQTVKANGGKIFQKYNAAQDMICIGDRRNVRVASLIKQGGINIIRPSWIFDCIKQAPADLDRPKLLLPFEPKHVFHIVEESNQIVAQSMDKYNDSYARNVDVEELRLLLDAMPAKYETAISLNLFKSQLQDHNHNFGELAGRMFQNLVFFIDGLAHPTTANGTTSTTKPVQSLEPSALRIQKARNLTIFGGGRIAADLVNEDITHVILAENDKAKSRQFREQLYR